MRLRIRNNLTAALAVASTMCVATLALAEDAQSQAVQVAAKQQVAQTQPVRRMIWDRARVAIELGRREALARRAVDQLERQAKAAPLDANVAPALERARRELARIHKANEEARREMAGDVVLEKAAYLGIASTPAAPVLRKQLKIPDGVGLVIDFVEPDSPAAEAGVQPDDVAVRLNDQVLINPQQLAVLVRTFAPGTPITLTLFRGGKEMPVPVTLVEREVKPLSDSGFGGGFSGVAGGGPLAFQYAVNPFAAQPKDATPLKPGDLVRVTVYDLAGPGAQTVSLNYLDREGQITLPQLKTPVRVAGTSGRKLVDTIRDAYQKAGLLEHARVNVQLMKPAPEAGGEIKKP